MSMEGVDRQRRIAHSRGILKINTICHWSLVRPHNPGSPPGMGDGEESPGKGGGWGGGKWLGTSAYNEGRIIMRENDKGVHSVLSSARTYAGPSNFPFQASSLCVALPHTARWFARRESKLRKGQFPRCYKIVQPRG
jgi:hypothetical protein